jgi:hypothetical protein
MHRGLKDSFRIKRPIWNKLRIGLFSMAWCKQCFELYFLNKCQFQNHSGYFFMFIFVFGSQTIFGPCKFSNNI